MNDDDQKQKLESSVVCVVQAEKVPNTAYIESEQNTDQNALIEE